ncbi:MAG: ferrochelatase [Gammaproteobacteria bacterium]|nr:ferrochelatase [Gammaproteobacteria bacterium]
MISTGILLTNLGTPDAPTPAALRRYLGEFLSDPRLVEMPRWLWRLILHGVVLRTRPRRSAALYKKIWTEAGSPLLQISREQGRALSEALNARFTDPVHMAIGMRYGSPSIAAGLEALHATDVRRILVFPLYPQYSSATVGSTLDAVCAELKTWRNLPDLRFISRYYDDEDYIQALAAHIQAWRKTHGQANKLLFSFHGIPEKAFLAGDPYPSECRETARLTAERLDLSENAWQTVFQSRFGREEWVKPYTDHTLQALGKAGTKRVDVVCPGFSADCLETLEEIAHTNRNIFLDAGGGEFHYIPALNASPEHIHALAQIVIRHIS